MQVTITVGVRHYPGRGLCRARPSRSPDICRPPGTGPRRPSRSCAPRSWTAAARTRRAWRAGSARRAPGDAERVTPRPLRGLRPLRWPSTGRRWASSGDVRAARRPAGVSAGGPCMVVVRRGDAARAPRARTGRVLARLRGATSRPALHRSAPTGFELEQLVSLFRAARADLTARRVLWQPSLRSRRCSSRRARRAPRDPDARRGRLVLGVGHPKSRCRELASSCASDASPELRSLRASCSTPSVRSRCCSSGRLGSARPRWCGISPESSSSETCAERVPVSSPPTCARSGSPMARVSAPPTRCRRAGSNRRAR